MELTYRSKRDSRESRIRLGYIHPNEIKQAAQYDVIMLFCENH